MNAVDKQTLKRARINSNSLSFKLKRYVLIFLLATLPFFNIRIESFEGTLTHVGMLLVIIYSFGGIFVGAFRFDRILGFDAAHVMFLFLASISVLFFNIPESGSVLVKSGLYFLFYICLSGILSSLARPQVFEVLVQSARYGLIACSILFLIAALQANLVDSVLSSGINFYSFTFRLYEQIYEMFNLSTEFRPPDVRRNTVGGVFAFYFSILLFAQIAWSSKPKRWKLDKDTIMLVVTLMFVLALFSRRALIACFLIVFLSAIVGRASRGQLIGISLVGVVVILYAFLGLEVDNRFTQFDDDSRYDQFITAFYYFIENPFSGVGYGSKLGVGNTVFVERYVHNYFLANVYMLGISGFIVSAYVGWVLLKKISLTLFNREGITNLLLVIPLLSMLVAGAVEGIYVPLSWIIFAICFHSRVSVRR